MSIKNLPFILSQADRPEGIYKAMAIFMVIAIVGICIYYVSRYVETLYAKKHKKPYFVHWYPRLRKLPTRYSKFLSGNQFYTRLHPKQKKYFQHRLVVFLKETKFVGREELVITDEIRMEIAMLVIQMTFGMRHYMLQYLQTIIVYPSAYFSILNQTEHHGEFNPMAKALVLAWDHFQKGNLHQDGINLGIHEITHAIHYNSIKNSHISAELFYDTFLELENYLGTPEVRNEIVATNLLREYAFTDKFEFIAVLVEVFMESPLQLKQQLPEVYGYVQRMLNFRYFD